MEDKVVLVTGANSGIGAGTCEVFSRAGATVVALDRSFTEDGGLKQSAVAQTAITVDVSVPDAVRAAFDEIISIYGRVDAVVHAAGVDDPAVKDQVYEFGLAGEPVLTLTDLSNEQWERMRSINLDGAFFVLREAARVMLRAGRGSIVLVGSEAAVHGIAGLVHYGAAKSGVHGLTRAAAKELAAFGVRVNAIAPGVIDTPMSRRSRGAYADGDVSPLGRLGAPSEIGNVALFLCSDLASYVVGEVINVDGGRLAC